MPHFAASDLVLHCFPMSHKKESRLKMVKRILQQFERTVNLVLVRHVMRKRSDVLCEQQITRHKIISPCIDTISSMQQLHRQSHCIYDSLIASILATQII